VIINGTPETGFTSTAPQCTGLTVDFTNTGTTGLSYSWDFGTGATPSTSTDENPTGIIYSSSGSKIISLTTTNTGSGCSVTTNQSININQTPNTGFTSTAPVCVEEGVDFSNTGTSGNEWIYNWDFGEDANPSTSTSENPVNIMYSTGGSKSVSLTIFNSFCSNTSTDIIDINSLPIAFAGIDTTICANRSIQLGTDPTADYQYSWFPPNIFDFPESSNPIASPIASFTNIILTVTNLVTGCQAIDSVSLTMLNPMIANAGNDVEICFGDVIQIGASLIEGQYYTWSPTSGLDDAFLPNPLSSPDTTTLYTLTVNANGCDPVFDEVLVQVHPLPDANAGLNDTITTGSEIRLIATGGIQYIWSPPYALSNTAVFNPIANPTETTIYTVSVTDVYGCVNSDDVEIMVIDPSYWIPNAFTPDGNGTNDVFYVRGEGISNFELYIFDRSGHLVYYSQDFYEGWTGKMQGSNKELPEGAYLFKIKGTDSTGSPIEDSGMINLIR
jgi:gliding motility-associated-like protein